MFARRTGFAGYRKRRFLRGGYPSYSACDDRRGGKRRLDLLAGQRIQHRLSGGLLVRAVGDQHSPAVRQLCL